jgi:AAA domain-containing protein
VTRDLAQLAQTYGDASGEGRTSRTLDVVSAADVMPELIEWLWRGWLPFDHFGEIGGPPGVGKSTLVYDLIARLSRGVALPDGASCDAVNVAVLAAEDLLGSVVRPRLSVAGADLNRVRLVKGTFVGDAGEPDALSLPRDLGLLETFVHHHGIRFIYVDALIDVLPPFESYRDADTRRVLRPLAAFARDMGVTIMGSRHFNKAPGIAAIHAANGSVAFSAVSRFMLQVHPDPNDTGRRVLTVAKSNLARRPASLAFTLVADGLDDPPRVQWLGEDPRTADDLLLEAATAAPGSHADGDGANADKWLAELLMDGVTEQRAILDAAAAAGFAQRTVYRAAHRLHVERAVSGFGRDKRSTWHLPTVRQFCHDGQVLPHPEYGKTEGPVAKLEADSDALARAPMRNRA